MEQLQEKLKLLDRIEIDNVREFLREKLQKHPEYAENLTPELVEYINVNKITNPYAIWIFLMPEEKRREFCKTILWSIFEAGKQLMTKKSLIEKKRLFDKLSKEFSEKLDAIIAAFLYTCKEWAVKEIYVPMIQEAYKLYTTYMQRK